MRTQRARTASHRAPSPWLKNVRSDKLKSWEVKFRLRPGGEEHRALSFQQTAAEAYQEIEGKFRWGSPGMQIVSVTEVTD